jgi:hypothetical protein
MCSINWRELDTAWKPIKENLASAYSQRKNAGLRSRESGCSSLEDYPTPSAWDWRDGRASDKTMGKNARPLNEFVISGSGNPNWPTPKAGERGQYQRDNMTKGKERANLTGAVKGFKNQRSAPSAAGSAGEDSPDLILDGQKFKNKKTGRVLQSNLATEVKFTKWSTPNVPNGGRALNPKIAARKGAKPDGGKAQLGLADQVKIWPSPRKTSTTGKCDHGDGGPDIQSAAKANPNMIGSLPASRCHLLYSIFGTELGRILRRRYERRLPDGRRRRISARLSAKWVSALMGLPENWTTITPTNSDCLEMDATRTP